MSNIQQNLAKILSSRYGRDVRQSIHDGIHNCYEDGKAGSIDLVARELIQQKMSGSPAGTYADLEALILANPDHSKIYITLDNGNWNYHNGSAWVAGGVYQATERPLDTTLSVSGMAADAKATGDISNKGLYAITGNKYLTDWSDNHRYINTGVSVGTVVNIDGYTTTKNANVRYLVYSCTAGEKFVITSSGGLGSRAYAFLDSDKKVTTNRSASNAVYTDYVVQAQENGYLVVNDTTLNGYVIVNETLVSKVSKAYQRMTTLTSEDDLNNVITSGWYNFLTASVPTNSPIQKGGILTVTAIGNFVEQVYYAAPEEYHRFKGSGGWGNWINFTTPYTINGLLTSSDDLDNITVHGTYHAYTYSPYGLPANVPVNKGGLLTVFSSGDLVEQMYYSDREEYHRFKGSGGWRPWKEEKNEKIIGLPILNLNGNITNMSKKTAVPMTYSIFGITGDCTVKWQGSSSLRYAKKNYTVKFDTNFDAWYQRQLFVNTYRASAGDVSRVDTTSRWGEQKKYVTKANWIDASMMRNIICARLWGEIVKTRVDAGEVTDRRATAPNYGAIDGFPIGIEINDINVGLYTMNIPKDTWTFDMGTETTEYLVTGENNSSKACRWKALATFDENQSGERDVDFDYEYVPDGVSNDTVKTSFNTAIQAVINAHENWETDVAQYVDVDSVFDYFIFACCISNEDGFARNLIYGTYDGVKWFLSAYDMDATFGVNVYGSDIYNVISSRAQFTQAANFNRLAHLMVNYSKEKLKERYAELRAGILSERHVFEMLSKFAVDISSHNYEVDRNRWGRLPGTSIATVCQYMEFYKLHCAYLDNEVANL